MIDTILLITLCRASVFEGWLTNLHQGIESCQGCISQGQECPSCTKMWCQKPVICPLCWLRNWNLVVNGHWVLHYSDSSFYNIWLWANWAKVCTLKNVCCDCSQNRNCSKQVAQAFLWQLTMLAYCFFQSYLEAHPLCCTHTLNTCVDEAIQKPAVQWVLAWGCNVVSFLHCSPLATAQLKKEKQEEL